MTLVWLAAAFIIGIFLGSTVAAPGTALFGAALVLTVGAVVLWRRRSMRLAMLLMVLFLLGTGRAETARVHIGPGDVAYYNGRTVTLMGFVNTEPDVRDTGNNYVISVDHMVRAGHNLPVGGQLELHTAPGQVLNEGDEVQLTGILKTPTNSPKIPYRSILANRGIYSQMSFARMFVTGRVSLGVVGWADQIRQWIENTISTTLPEPEATFLIAILIGGRSAQLGNLAPVLIQTGLIHLIAVSGIKIAIVAGTVNGFLQRLLSRTPRLLASVLVLASYWLVSGATVAGLRASIMWLLVFLALYLGRPTHALVSLGIAVSVMLAFSPALLWDTGFQLTAIGTAAIVAFAPLLQRATLRLPAALAASLSTTLAAQAGVLPVQIVSFHVVSPVSLLANAVVLPFIPLTMVAGFLTAILPHTLFAPIAYALVHALILIAQWAARFHLYAHLSSVPIAISLAYYAALLFLAALAWRVGPSRRHAAKGEWLWGLTVAAFGLSVAMAAPLPANRIEFITNGDALLTSHGQHVLIDGGVSGSKLLVGISARLPYPNDRLDAIINTSPAAKNVAALLEVAQHVPVGEVIDPGIEYPTQTYGRWRSWPGSHHIPVVALRPGLLLHGRGFSIRALAPDAIYSNPKDGAGILLITFDRRRILYLGDASAREQQDLPFQVDVRCDTIISAVPIDPILARASGFSHLIRPIAGQYLALGR